MPQTLAQLVRTKYPGVYDDLSDQQLETKVKAKYPGVYDDVPTSAPAKPVEATPNGGVLSTAADVVKGLAKGAGSTVAGLGEMAVNAGMVPGVTPAAFATDMRSPVFEKTDKMTTATNTAQQVGKAAEMVAELALPTGEAAKAVPRVSRAAGKFEQVMGAARNVPVNVNATGEAALRIQQLAERGGSMPKAVRDFLKRVTDPDKGEMTYQEARDFASNISRLSANEMGRLTPVIAREVASMRVALNRAVADAAGKAGKGREYAEAMNEYARAMRLKGAIDDFWNGAKKVAPYATAAGAGTWLTKKVLDAIGND